jgi:two-component system alkaline phosphatase synthesis response regulator PhoP
MSEQTILLIDDDPILLELLSDHVRMAGYQCLTASDGNTGLRLATQAQPDLVVLDVMMAGLDGWEVCQHLRAHSTVPIIMLTAKNQEFDKLHGFRLGVDDYVTKPFSFAELLARIGAVLNRTRHTGGSEREMTRGDLIIDFDRHQVSLAGKPINLTPTEYRLLETLAHNAGRTVPIEELLDDAWGPEYQGQADQVKHYIWSLRKKIERDPGDPEHIVTERGWGYRFE